MRDATWAVIKLNEEESEEDNALEVFQELQEAEWVQILQIYNFLL